MKLITNTIEEAKENAEPSIKENFEPETIFDHNMKDLAADVPKNDLLNGSGDSSCKDLKKINGSIENKNGIIKSDDVSKPVSVNGTAFLLSDCEEISDGELNFVPSDEEENLLTADSEDSPSSGQVSCKKNVLGDNDGHNAGVVNGCSDTTDDSGNQKSDDAETSGGACESSLVVDAKSKDEDVRLGSEAIKFDDLSEVTENVKEIVEVCTSEEIEDTPLVESTSSENKNSSVENDDGSDAENDREAKEKLLTLLKETPPELVILPEEQNVSEKDVESVTDEAMLSLLEDSQSDSNLNLLSDVIGSSTLSGFENDKKPGVDVVKPEENNSASEDSEKAVDCKLETSDEKVCLDDSVCDSTNIEKKDSIIGKEQISSKDVKGEGLSEEHFEMKKECPEKAEKEEEKEVKKENEDKKPISSEDSQTEILNVEMPLKVDESLAESKLSDENKNTCEEVIESTETTSSSSLSQECNSGEETGDKTSCIKRNHNVTLNPLSAKKLKRSTSCEEKNEKITRKRSYSVDDQGNSDEQIDIKRFRQSLEGDLSEKPQVEPDVKENEESVEDNKETEAEVKEKTDAEAKEIIGAEVEKKIDVVEILEKNKLDTSDKDSVDIIASDLEKSNSISVDKSVVNSDNNEKTVSTCQNEKIDSVIQDSEITSGPKETSSTSHEEKRSNESNDDASTSYVPSKDDVTSNVDTGAVRAAQGSWKSITKDLSLITKIHKDKFKSLTRWDLEELIVQKICESISDRSVIGELRQRVKSLENAIDNWRKKSQLIEKSNREMRTVLNRYLKEVDDNIADKTKPLIPIRITRSVGLQVIPPVSHDKFKNMNRTAQPQQSQRKADNIRTLRPAPPVARDNSNNSGPKTSPSVPQRTTPVISRALAPKPSPPKQQVVNQNVHNVNNAAVRRVAPVNQINESVNSPATANVATSKRIVSTASPVSSAPSNSSSDLEVIDLTDKEEKSMARGVVTAGNVRFIPRAAANTVAITSTAVAQPMTLVVPTSAMQAVRGNQRQQLFLTTAAPNGTAQIRPVTSATVVTGRPNTSNPSLTIPGATAVMMKNGTIVPIASQPTTANVVVRSSNPPLLSRSVQQLRLATPVSVAQSQPLSHPAPLPACPPVTSQVGWLHIPPRPILKVSKTGNGIMLSWSMTLSKNHEEIASYQLYAYQESNNIPPSSTLWKKVGDVKALPLPMACTLTQFVEGHKYHFAVRAVDVHSRVGQFSLPSTILLK